MNALYGEFKMSERDMALREAAERYVRECEQYDLTVCTGPITIDGVMPEGTAQALLVSKNSRRVLERISTETAFSRSEIVRAAARIDPRSITL